MQLVTDCSWTQQTLTDRPRGHQIAGDYAARAISSLWKSGYQCRKVTANSLLSVWVRVCSSKCAPRLVPCIDCRFTKRLLSTELTVDSTNAVEIVSPL